MARIRTIKPELPHSESMGRVSRDARLLFMLLFTLVDDFGRTRAASRLLASLLYPYDNDAPALMDGWKAELAAEGCITLYEVDGTQYLEITNWLKHQKIDHPSRSKFPGPSESLARPREPLAKSCSGKGKGSGSGPGEDLDQEKEEDVSRSRERAGEHAQARAGPDDWPEDYRDQFSRAYPHKVGMAPALKALEAARADGRVSWRFLMAALGDYAGKTDDRAWCNPKTWIEQERWNDKPGKPTGKNGHARAPAGERSRRLAREMEARSRQGTGSGAADAVGGAELGGEHARLVPGTDRQRP